MPPASGVAVPPPMGVIRRNLAGNRQMRAPAGVAVLALRRQRACVGPALHPRLELALRLHALGIDSQPAPHLAPAHHERRGVRLGDERVASPRGRPAPACRPGRSPRPPCCRRSGTPARRTSSSRRRRPRRPITSRIRLARSSSYAIGATSPLRSAPDQNRAARAGPISRGVGRRRANHDLHGAEPRERPACPCGQAQPQRARARPGEVSRGPCHHAASQAEPVRVAPRGGARSDTAARSLALTLSATPRLRTSRLRCAERPLRAMCGAVVSEASSAPPGGGGEVVPLVRVSFATADYRAALRGGAAEAHDPVVLAVGDPDGAVGVDRQTGRIGGRLRLRCRVLPNGR